VLVLALLTASKLSKVDWSLPVGAGLPSVAQFCACSLHPQHTPAPLTSKLLFIPLDQHATSFSDHTQQSIAVVLLYPLSDLRLPSTNIQYA
jgi:hypothetical protein